MEQLKYAALFTGGKDSTRAIHWALDAGLNVKYLVTMIPERIDSWMFHASTLNVTDLAAEALGIPLVKGKTKGVKEEEVEDLKNVLAKLDVDGVISGSVASVYQKSRLERICRELGLRLLTPLWGYDQEKLVEEVLRLGYDVLIVAVSALGLDGRWLGRRLDQQAFTELKKLHEKYGVSLTFEGGEGETLVLDCPIYRKRLEILEYDTVWDGRAGYLIVRKARLVAKGSLYWRETGGKVMEGLS